MQVKSLESKARSTAKNVGLVARKSRRYAPPDLLGGFMLVDSETGFPVAGFHYDLAPEGAIKFCKRYAES